MWLRGARRAQRCDVAHTWSNPPTPVPVAAVSTRRAEQGGVARAAADSHRKRRGLWSQVMDQERKRERERGGVCAWRKLPRPVEQLLLSFVLQARAQRMANGLACCHFILPRFTLQHLRAYVGCEYFVSDLRCCAVASFHLCLLALLTVHQNFAWKTRREGMEGLAQSG